MNIFMTVSDDSYTCCRCGDWILKINKNLKNDMEPLVINIVLFFKMTYLLVTEWLRKVPVIEKQVFQKLCHTNISS